MKDTPELDHLKEDRRAAAVVELRVIVLIEEPVVVLILAVVLCTVAIHGLLLLFATDYCVEAAAPQGAAELGPRWVRRRRSSNNGSSRPLLPPPPRPPFGAGPQRRRRWRWLLLRLLLAHGENVSDAEGARGSGEEGRKQRGVVLVPR